MIEPKLNFEALNSEDQKRWKEHRELLLTVKGDHAGYRGCIGVGLAVDTVTADTWLPVGSRYFLPDDVVKWLFLVDVPVGYFRLSRKHREVHWATARRTTVKYGMPSLPRGSEGTDAWAFRVMPFDTASRKDNAGEVHAGPDVLDPVANAQLFRAFNALEWSMTSTAFNFRRPWMPGRKALWDAVGLPFKEGSKLLLFGSEPCDKVERPGAWMPRAYLAFPEELAPKLFDRATRVGPFDKLIYMEPDPVGEGLRWAFCRAMTNGLAWQAPFDGLVESVSRETYKGMLCLTVRLAGDRGQQALARFTREARVVAGRGLAVKNGDVIAEETFRLPEGWDNRSPRSRWERAENMFLSLDWMLRTWFEREILHLAPGLVHVSTELASPAALGSAVDENLFWDISPSLPYWNESCDSFIFPTLQMSGWDDFRGVLPGDVAYDVAPADQRFLPSGTRGAGKGSRTRPGSVAVG
jgi:hypothetical protein